MINKIKFKINCKHVAKFLYPYCELLKNQYIHSLSHGRGAGGVVLSFIRSLTSGKATQCFFNSYIKTSTVSNNLKI